MSLGGNNEERSIASNRSAESATQLGDAGPKTPNKTDKRKSYKQSEMPLTDNDPDLRSDNLVERPLDAEFVLLCIQQKPHRIKLVHANIYGKSNDREAFANMKSTYKTYRASWWRLNRLSHVEFRKVSNPFMWLGRRPLIVAVSTLRQPACRY